VIYWGGNTDKGPRSLNTRGILDYLSRLLYVHLPSVLDSPYGPRDNTVKYIDMNAGWKCGDYGQVARLSILRPARR